MNQETYMTEQQAGAMLTVSPRSLQRWRTSGHGPKFVKAGRRRVLYRVTDVEAFLLAQTFASTAEAKRHLH